MFLIGVTNCTFISDKESPKEKAFADLYPVISFNEYIYLQEDTSVRTMSWYRYSSDIFIIVKNITNKEILLLIKDGPDLWIYDGIEQKWNKIFDRGEYIDFSDTIIYPEKKNRIENTWIIPIDPNIGERDKLTMIRVVVLGEVMENNQPTGKKVGGYLDITYQPESVSMFEP